MAAVYVLNVPEFLGLAESVRNCQGISVTDSGRGYTIIEAHGELEFNRKATGFKPAVWYGAFTGGVEGRIVEFGRDVVRVVDEDRAGR
jgi:hypothetical protein